jgi:U2 small nuclear ribonucleoprotein A'
LLTRLRSLLVNNNKIVKISTSLGDSLPNLDTLILTNNKLTNLNDVDALAEIKSLRKLSLLDNPVTKKAQYRLYVIHRIPQIKLCDFFKIKEKESAAAARLFIN